MDIRTIDIDDREYPEHLRNIPGPPELLYYIGNIKLIEHPLIAIVGTRRCSPYGKWAAEGIAARVAACGISVVSGMAEGIDSAAHKGCIKAGTPTVAVLGTGIDVCFPKSNLDLYRRIAEDGLILSEYPPGTVGASWTFPERNRIISGLSKSVVVVEGTLKSGSMITARLALEQGRDVYAVPGNINQPGSAGVNKLISDGACPILDMESAAQTLGLSGAKKIRRIEALSVGEKLVLGAVIEAPGSGPDAVALKTGLQMNEVLAFLGALELKDLIRSSGQRYYPEQ